MWYSRCIYLVSYEKYVFMKFVIIIKSFLFFPGFNLDKNTLKTDENCALFYHRLLETFKHTFAKRSYLGDVDFIDLSEVCNIDFFINQYNSSSFSR
jgi:hypothetical protein